MQQEQRQEPFWIGPEETETACLLIHGFMGTPAEMRELGEALATQGFRVYGMLVAGHSGDTDEFIHARYEHWVASVEDGFAQLSRYPHVFVIGLSMGGVLSLYLAGRHPERIAGVIALSTPTRILGGWKLGALLVGRYFIKWLYPLKMMNFADPGVQKEVLKQARLRNPDVVIDFNDEQTVKMIQEMVRIPVPSIHELVQLTALERRQLAQIRVPLLILHSKRDQTVNPACAKELLRLATHANPKELRWLEQSDHVITTGPEREKVNALCLSFIRAIMESRNVHRGSVRESHPER